MARWLNRIKYKGRSPVLAGATSGPNKKMLYDGYNIHEYIQQSGPSNDSWWISSHVLQTAMAPIVNYIDLPIKANKLLTMRLKFVPIYGASEFYVGSFNVNSTDEYEDWRMFVYSSNNELMFDNGAYRIGTWQQNTWAPFVATWGTQYDFTFGHFYYKNNDTQQIWGPNTPVPATVKETVNLRLSIDRMRMNLIQFWDGNNNLIFDAYPVMDNGDGKLWDNVTQQYFTFPYAVDMVQL